MQTPLGNGTVGNHLFTLDINRQTSQPALFSFFFSVGTDVFWELIKEASAPFYLIPSNAEAILSPKAQLKDAKIFENRGYQPFEC